jgi:hypothetical protein
MSERTDLVEQMYRAFNERDLSAMLSAMHPEVDWPNGWKGGRLNGRDAVRHYWQEQWSEVDSKVTALALREAGGRVEVAVRQWGHDHEGKLLFDEQVRHIYEFEDDLIGRMTIEAPE